MSQLILSDIQHRRKLSQVLIFVNFGLIFYSRVVIETLKEVDGGRKCYRMIGGILVEGTVKEILPNLITNSEQVNTIAKQNIKVNLFYEFKFFLG